ncbi:SO2930 family diheme c-type cytochrome [Pseudohongiella sp.]|uniref:Cytochrome c domain-containing protein n=1 Tax=marine sediment metagenome TaxID=412755 RepID=A0A0F9YQK5_9ZZZZ|nr:SO2930 family diheme c-type cytochrome [Pseudohongiella sp.]HDZ10200.1 hypothetical protein [Pseudohongiella sp.]HEA64268.1 hypothetical protein [Pseudohongiella sp.]
MPVSRLTARLSAVAALVLSGMLSSCQDPGPHVFDSSNYPARLSAWQLLQVQGRELELNDAVLPYQLATPLFSDYALKLRTVWLPDGTAARYRDNEPFDFPVGTVISKTFYYPLDTGADNKDMPRLLKASANQSEPAGTSLDLNDFRLIETRLLVHQPSGWEALPYVWNDEQTDATLQITGDIQRLQLEGTTFAYIVPNRNECAGCHVLDQNKGDLSPIGPAARHLNRLISHENGELRQLTLWQQRGWLTGLPEVEQIPANAVWQDSANADDSVPQRARAYLDINCGHCHQPGGSGDTSGLFLHAAETSAMRLGVCKPPVAAGRGAGGHRFSIVPGQPENSILSYRIESQETGVLMPELGRSLVHEQGLQLVNTWIAQRPGHCN